MSDTWILNDDGTATFNTLQYGSITVDASKFTDGIGQDIIDIRTTHNNYHEYHHVTDLGISVGEAGLDVIHAGLAVYPTPFGLFFAGPGFVTHSSEGSGIVTNYTTDFHSLDPGVVQRKIIVIDGRYHVDTTGIGIGINPYDINVSLADEVWGFADDRIRAWIKDTIEDGGIRLVPKYCFAAGTMIDMWDGSQKPIEQIAPDDRVVSYDEAGTLRPGRVSAVKVNQVRHTLDFHTLMVTPGHVMLCGDGPFAGRHAPLIDILRSDGAVVRRDGTAVRAATNCAVGSAEDGFVWAVTGDRADNGGITVRDKGRIRLGTRASTPDGDDVSVAELIVGAGGAVTPDGLVRRGGAGPAMPFLWTFSEMLPKPEDYVLQRSGLTLTEIYRAGEWEGEGPMLAAPPGSRRGAMAVN